jgi:hypothetical protein
MPLIREPSTIVGSPFPEDFDEHRIYYHCGTATAVEAGLLTKDDILLVLDDMINNMRFSGAASIGLTVYPPYPEGFFKNPQMKPFSYQNGGDWTWFGGRMVQQLIAYSYIEQGYEQILPFVERVKENDGFFEWYNVGNEPKDPVVSGARQACWVKQFRCLWNGPSNNRKRSASKFYNPLIKEGEYDKLIWAAAIVLSLSFYFVGAITYFFFIKKEPNLRTKNSIDRYFP